MNRFILSWHLGRKCKVFLFSWKLFEPSLLCRTCEFCKKNCCTWLKSIYWKLLLFITPLMPCTKGTAWSIKGRNTQVKSHSFKGVRSLTCTNQRASGSVLLHRVRCLCPNESSFSCSLELLLTCSRKLTPTAHQGLSLISLLHVCKNTALNVRWNWHICTTFS